MKAFFDTNVIVYAFDASAPAKRTTAQRLFAQCAADGTLLLSVQVLQEFYVTVTRKLERRLPEDEAVAAVESLSAFPVVATDAPMVLAALNTHRRAAISFWDALIVEAARAGGAAVLYSEDLHDGLDFGGLRVSNPFSRTRTADLKRLLARVEGGRMARPRRIGTVAAPMLLCAVAG